MMETKPMEAKIPAGAQPLLVTSSPHLRDTANTRRIMLDVILALLPAVGTGIWLFGLNAALIVLVTTVSCLASEYVMRVLILKRDNRIGDLSAVVTGLLLAMNFPPTLPLWLAGVGGAVAIVLVKELFGGLGMNFMNPALGARVFLFLAWPAAMTTWKAPLDAITGATPLAILKGKEAAGALLPNLQDLVLGLRGGCIGETSVVALLIGAAYLLFRRVISPRVPLLYLGTVALLTWAFGGTASLFTGNFLVHLLSGGLILGAFFMATDYVTQPISGLGKIVYALCLGLVTVVIRLWTNYPEGVSFAIILMNCLVPIIDRYTIPKTFGGRRA